MPTGNVRSSTPSVTLKSISTSVCAGDAPGLASLSPLTMRTRTTKSSMPAEPPVNFLKNSNKGLGWIS